MEGLASLAVVIDILIPCYHSSNSSTWCLGGVIVMVNVSLSKHISANPHSDNPDFRASLLQLKGGNSLARLDDCAVSIAIYIRGGSRRQCRSSEESLLLPVSSLSTGDSTDEVAESR